MVASDCVDVEEGAAERLAEREAMDAEGFGVRVGADPLADALGDALREGEPLAVTAGERLSEAQPLAEGVGLSVGVEGPVGGADPVAVGLLEVNAEADAAGDGLAVCCAEKVIDALCVKVGGKVAVWLLVDVASEDENGLLETVGLSPVVTLGVAAAWAVAVLLGEAERVEMPLAVSKGVSAAEAFVVPLSEAGAAWLDVPELEGACAPKKDAVADKLTGCDVEGVNEGVGEEEALGVEVPPAVPLDVGVGEGVSVAVSDAVREGVVVTDNVGKLLCEAEGVGVLVESPLEEPLPVSVPLPVAAVVTVAERLLVGELRPLRVLVGVGELLPVGVTYAENVDEVLLVGVVEPL